ncbi:MAG: DUF6382 domain-containing protein [Eubacteriales bacterium]|nr:DUF6382 domain-containing protein [Eubacteriales bacterium]
MKMKNKELNITFEKNIKNYSIFIEDFVVDKNTYEAKVLENEKIEKVLPLEYIYYENKENIKISINNYIPLDEIIKKRKLTFKDIISLIEEINNVFINLNEYIINESSLVLDTRLILLDREKLFDSINFVVLPNYNSNLSFEISKLLIKILRSVDNEDEDALKISYSLFQISQMDNYNIDDLLSVVNKYKKKNNYLYDFDKNDKEEYYNKLAINEKSHINEYSFDTNYNDIFNNTRSFNSYSINNDKNENIKYENIKNESIESENNIITNFSIEKNNNLKDFFDTEDETNDEENQIKEKEEAKRKNKKSFIKPLLFALVGITIPICVFVLFFS